MHGPGSSHGSNRQAPLHSLVPSQSSPRALSTKRSPQRLDWHVPSRQMPPLVQADPTGRSRQRSAPPPPPPLSGGLFSPPGRASSPQPNASAASTPTANVHTCIAVEPTRCCDAQGQQRLL